MTICVIASISDKVYRSRGPSCLQGEGHEAHDTSNGSDRRGNGLDGTAGLGSVVAGRLGGDGVGDSGSSAARSRGGNGGSADGRGDDGIGSGSNGSNGGSCLTLTLLLAGRDGDGRGRHRDDASRKCLVNGVDARAIGDGAGRWAGNRERDTGSGSVCVRRVSTLARGYGIYVQMALW